MSMAFLYANLFLERAFMYQYEEKSMVRDDLNPCFALLFDRLGLTKNGRKVRRACWTCLISEVEYSMRVLMTVRGHSAMAATARDRPASRGKSILSIV